MSYDRETRHGEENGQPEAADVALPPGESATKCDKVRHSRRRKKAKHARARREDLVDGLKPAQAAALQALLSGKSVTKAASLAEVNPRTVHRWLERNVRFQAALNQGRREMRDAANARLAWIAEHATACIARAIVDGNPWVALQLLRGLGYLPGKSLPLGSDDPKQLADEQAQLDTILQLLEPPQSEPTDAWR